MKIAQQIELKHFGVLGMKWGRRKAAEPNDAAARFQSRLKKLEDSKKDTDDNVIKISKQYDKERAREKEIIKRFNENKNNAINKAWDSHMVKAEKLNADFKSKKISSKEYDAKLEKIETEYTNKVKVIKDRAKNTTNKTVQAERYRKMETLELAAKAGSVIVTYLVASAAVNYAYKKAFLG